MNPAVGIRLVGLTLLSAALALGVRAWALSQVAGVARPVAEVLATGAAASVSKAPAPVFALPPPRSVFAPATAIPVAAPTPAPKTSVKSAASTNAKSGFTVSAGELDEALRTRLGGATTRPVRDDAGRVVGLSVHGVSRLARFGVAEGDRLVSANGLSLRTPDEALAALGALQHETKVTFVLQRGDARYAITVVLAA